MHLKKIFSLSLVAALSLPLTSISVVAQSPTLKQLRQETKAQKPKLAPDLEELLAQDDADEAARLQGKTLAEIRQERLTRKAKSRSAQTDEADTESTHTRIGGMLLPSAAVGAEETQSFIVQTDGSTPNVVLQEKLALLGGRIKQQHGQMGLLTIKPRAPRFVSWRRKVAWRTSAQIGWWLLLVILETPPAGETRGFGIKETRIPIRGCSAAWDMWRSLTAVFIQTTACCGG